MKFHPAAEVFPLLKGKEFAALVSDIRAHGLNQPILLFEGAILDGRNRWLACEEAGVKPRTEAWNEGNPWDFVWSQNAARRHLKPGQKAAICRKVTKESTAWVVAQQAHEEEANAARSAASKGNKNAAKGGDKNGVPSRGGTPSKKKGKKGQHSTHAAADLAKASDTSPATSARVLELEKKAPELLEKVEKGELELGAAVKQMHRDEKAEKVKAAVSELAGAPLEACELRVCSMQDLLGEQRDLDAIITDPPYPEKFLPLYGELARLEKAALKPAGVLAVMCGQSYLPRILAEMSAEIEYRWTIAYLTPGGQSVQLWNRNVNTFWKPVFIFGGKPKWMGDVVSSDVNDNDKRFHGWGQSESGMAALVERLTEPGQLVCDPFLGGGTTALACLTRGRHFIGCDIEESCIETTRGRVALALKDL